MSLLLSDEAIAEAMNSMIEESWQKRGVKYFPIEICDIDPSVFAVAQAAVKHCLEQLEKERRIIHMPTDYMLYPLDKLHNADNCWLCAALREVGL